MRVTTCGIAALLMLLVTGEAGAQNKETPEISDTQVDNLLRDWSVRTRKIKSLYAEFTRTTVDKIWKTKEVAEGSARYLYPNRARLDITGENAESHILTGTGELWEYKPPIKQITIFKLPPEMVGQEGIEDGPLPFLFGTDPKKAKARYQFRVLKDGEKVVHLLVLPKLKEDQQNFARAEILLQRQTFLPEKLLFVEPNGNEITFDFKDRIWLNIQVDPQDFVPNRLGPPWKIIVQQVAGREGAQPPGKR